MIPMRGAGRDYQLAEENVPAKKLSRIVVKKGETILGFAIETPNGWWFNPNVFGRKSSRKLHPTAERCIPSWAKKLSDNRE